MKKLSSVQRRLLKEADEPQVPQPQVEQPKADAEEVSGELKTDVAVPKGNSEQVESLIKATELLQKVAADMDAAKFLIEQDLSDFSMGKKIESFKWETIKFISKLKEKIYHLSSTDETAKAKVSEWLGL